MYNRLISDLEKHNYVIEHSVGKGGFSKCFSVKSKKYTDEYFVCKCICVSHKDLSSKTYAAEIEALTNLIHPNIVSIFDHFHEDNYFYLILESCNGGSLDKTIMRKGKLDEGELQKYIPMMINAIKYLHNNNIAHHDIKPGNFLIDKHDRIKLTDFGFAQKYNPGQKSSNIMGSLAYAAPEVLEGKEHDPYKTDVWAFGVCVFQLATGTLPFVGSTPENLKMAIQNLMFTIPDNLSPSVSNIIENCLIRDPELRADMNTIHRLFFSQNELKSNSLGAISPFVGRSLGAARNYSRYRLLPLAKTYSIGKLPKLNKHLKQ